MVKWIVWNRTVCMHKNGYYIKEPTITDRPSNQTKPKPNLCRELLFEHAHTHTHVYMKANCWIKEMNWHFSLFSLSLSQSYT